MEDDHGSTRSNYFDHNSSITTNKLVPYGI